MKNVRIVNNTFAPKHGETDASDSNIPILLLGGNGIEISGNTYPSGVSVPVENRGGALNVTGSDTE